MVRTMTPVTDSNLIAQLEGGNTGLKPVTDPALISRLEGNTTQPTQTNPSLLPRIGADVLAGVATAGQGLHNAPYNIANMISPKLASYMPSPTNINFGQLFGVNAPNLGDKLLQGAAQYAPYMIGGEALIPDVVKSIPALEKTPLLNKYITSAINQAPTNAIFGLTQSQNPIAGAPASTAIGAAAALAPGLPKGISFTAGKITSAVQPQKYAEQILETLGGGNTLEGNAQSLAQDIQNAFNNRVEQGKALYQPVFDALGNNSIYEGLNPAASSYQALESGLLKNNRDLNTLNQQFISNPTLQNAHNLQSQLGTAIRKLQASDAKQNLSVADRNTMQGYQAAQNALRSDINTFLTNQNPALANQYNLATANWAQNVTPYLENSKISQIAKGDITNPKNITNLFKNPEPELQQIVDDIGPQASNKILYSELGKTQANLTPEKLTNAFSQLDNKGLISYVTPDLLQQFDQLGSKIAARDLAQQGAGLMGGGIIGSYFGIPLAETIGAGLGLGATKLMQKYLTSKASQYLPTLRMQLMNNALMGAGANIRPVANAIYRPLPGAIAADTVNSMGGQ